MSLIVILGWLHFSCKFHQSTPDELKPTKPQHSHHQKLHKTPLIRYSYRMNKQLTFLLLFSGSSGVFGDDYQDGWDAYERQDYKTAYKLWLPLAEQGFAQAQLNLGVMYDNGKGVPQDYEEAVKWYRLAAEQRHERAQFNLEMMHGNSSN